MGANRRVGRRDECLWSLTELRQLSIVAGQPKSARRISATCLSAVCLVPRSSFFGHANAVNATSLPYAATWPTCVCQSVTITMREVTCRKWKVGDAS